VAEQYRIFTFGYGQRHPVTDEPLADCYVRVPGDADTARERMLASVHHRSWAFDYPDEDAAGVTRFGLREIPWEGPS
jgi:hypothetical protein